MKTPFPLPPAPLGMKTKHFLNTSYVPFLCSDPAVKQFLLHLDEKMILGKKFVIEDLDETHLFVSAEIVPILQEKVWEIMDNNSFNIAQTN